MCRLQEKIINFAKKQEKNPTFYIAEKAAKENRCQM
jgi:hypothetical protein